MSVATLAPPPAPPAPPPASPQPRRWTREEYYQLAEEGYFQGQNVMLIGGEIITMAVQKPAHYTTIDRVKVTVETAFGPGFWARTQAPLDLGADSDAEPDVAIVPGSRSDYEERHPTSALLIVEVSDTTLSYDRTRKASLYASTGIADYWIVNLVDRQLEVRRKPVPDPAQDFGFRYDEVTILPPQGHAIPLAAPQARVVVVELLP